MRFRLGWQAILLIVGGWVSSAGAGLNHDPNLDWYSIETQHFIIHYHDGGDAVAQQVARLAEAVHARLSPWIQWQPPNKTHVVVSDESDLANGFAGVFPSAQMTLFVSPPDDINSLEDHDGWLEYLILHEYLHILHLDKATGLPSTLQNIFGRHPLLFPNEFQPRWLVEGIATFHETDHAQGVGRGQSSYADMIMRMEVLNGIKPVEQVNQPIASWPMGFTPYLYGVNYFQFLRDKYGESRVQAYLDNYSSNLIPFRINTTSAQTFGKELKPMWEEYSAYLREKYQPQLDRIRSHGERTGTALTQQGYFAGSLQAANGRLYFVADRGDTHPGLYVIDPGGVARKVQKVNRGSRIHVHPQHGVLLIQPELCRNAAVYYDLYRLDHAGHTLQRLTHCGRYHHAVWAGGGTHIIAAQAIQGKASLQRLDANGQNPQVLWQADDDTQISHLAISPDETLLVAAVWRRGAGWNLERFTLDTRQWQPLTHGSQIDNHPAFSADGRYLVYSAERNGVYNIERLELQTGEQSRLTHVIGGAFYPVLLQDALYYIGYHAGGFDVYALPEPTAVGRDEVTPRQSKSIAADYPASATAAPVAVSTPQAYSPWASLWPRWWFPHLLIDEQRSEIGAVTAGTDPLFRHRYGISAAYDIENDWWVGSFNYIYDRYWPIFHVFARRRTEIYLFNNDPIRLRQEDLLVGQMILPFYSLQDRYAVHVAALTDHEKDVWLAGGVTPFVDSQDDMLAVALTYRSASRFPKSVSRSEGREIRLIVENSEALGRNDYTGQVYVADWREFIHLGKEHVLALRLLQGYGSRQPRPFRLGGIQAEDNPLVALLGEVSEPLFNRRNYTLRGYDEGHAALSGRRLRLGSVEYRFPIDRPERGWMVPPLGLHQMHGTLFYETGATYRDGSPNRYFSSAGFEFNADVDIFYDLRVHMTLGYAHGFDNRLGENQVYLRLGHNF